MSEITHKQDENGILRQLVTPETLKKILDSQGEDYTKPKFMMQDDEWEVAEQGIENVCTTKRNNEV